MNRFLWNLRYPTAVQVKGAYISGRSVTVPIGPEVVPGTYYAVLTYGATTQRQPFVVELDPNLSTTQAGLQQRFELLMRIQSAMNRLDITLNQATAARSQLEKAVADRQVAGREAQQALADLNRDINGVIDFRIQSSRGFDVFPPRLRSWLSAIYTRVDFAYVQPTPEMTEVANGYMNDEREGVMRLQADIARASTVLKH
jgi:hypothetical protein